VGKIGLALSIGVSTGFGINTAHELGHKKEEAERGLAKCLAPTAYGHFYIEHNRGHHVRVPPQTTRRRAVWRELLPVLPAHGVRLAAQCLGAGVKRYRDATATRSAWATT